MNYNNNSFYKSYGLASQFENSDNPEIVFCGRSNVGKSSLINKILNRRSLARTSCSPGKTATINFFNVDNIFFVDLPGYGYAKVSKSEKKRWQNLINLYFGSNRNISLVIQLIDMRHPPSTDDIIMINFFIDIGQPFIIVFTKADKLNKSEFINRQNMFKSEIPCYDQIQKIETSAKNGIGIDQIKELIISVI